MASVALTQMWLHDAADPSTAYAFEVADLRVDTAKKVDVRPYANGRYRVITRPGTQRTLSCTVQLATRSDVEVLEGWVGTLLMVRDYAGRLLYGTYGSVSTSENGIVDRGDVALTITESSYTDTV